MLDYKEENQCIIDLIPDATIFLFDRLRLFIESTSKELEIKDTERVTLGRGQECTVSLNLEHDTNIYIAKIHAVIEKYTDYWLIYDNNSTNGTWINDVKMEQGKKYVLHCDDVIDFAHSEKVVFFKTMKEETGIVNGETARVMLETSMTVFYQSKQTDTVALQILTASLINTPLYIPMEIDMAAMFGGVDVTQLKVGDKISPGQDVKMKIRTMISSSQMEFVPLFTSVAEMEKAGGTSSLCMYPQDYLPKIMEMNMEAVINPLGKNPFVMMIPFINEVFWPIVKGRMQKTENVKKQTPNNAVDMIGYNINQHYRIKSVLGIGGFTKVYLADNIHTKQEYAVKAVKHGKA